MRIQRTILSAAMLAGLFQPGVAQNAAAPDPATVAKLQASIAKEEARGELHEARISLRSLLRLYTGNPAMQASVCLSLAQVSTQLGDSASASAYNAQAQKLSAQATAPPVSAVQPSVAASSYPPPSPVTAPGPQPPGPVAAQNPGNNANSTSKLSRFLSGANKFLEQAKQLQQPKGSGGAPSNPQPPPPPTNGFPPAPDGTPAPGGQPHAAAPAAGVVIGYDANNQPIFAPASPPPVATTAPAAGVVIGYDANNQPIFAPQQ